VLFLVALPLLVAKPALAATADLPMLHWNIIDAYNQTTVESDPSTISLTAGVRMYLAEFDASSIGGWSTVTHTDFYEAGNYAQIRPCKTTYNTAFTWSNFGFTGCPPGNANGTTPFSMFDDPAIYGYPDPYTDMMNNNVWYIESGSSTITPADVYLHVTYTAPTPTPTATPTPTPTATPTPTPWPNYNGTIASNSAQVQGASVEISYILFRDQKDSANNSPCNGYADCWERVRINIANYTTDYNILGYELGEDGTYATYKALPNAIGPNQFVKGEWSDHLAYYNYSWWSSHYPFDYPDAWIGAHMTPPVKFTLQAISDGALSTISGTIHTASSSAVPPVNNALGVLGGVPNVPISCGSINIGPLVIPDFFCELKQWLAATITYIFVPDMAKINPRYTASLNNAFNKAPWGYIYALQTIDLTDPPLATPGAIPDFHIGATHIKVENVVAHTTQDITLFPAATISGSTYENLVPGVIAIRNGLAVFIGGAATLGALFSIIAL
jgi:hypothetical protein